MARTDSFYLPPESWPTQGTALLQGSEARHMVKVLRLGPGAQVRCFDGQGRDGQFIIRKISKNFAELELASQSVAPPPEYGLTLAVGWSKSSRRGWLLEKAVELDAAGILFWRAERGQGRPPGQPKDTWQDKLVQAAKQCSAVWLPRLAVTGDVRDLAAFAPGYAQCYVLWEESAGQSPLLRPEDLAFGPSLVVVGPEGGLTLNEVDVLRQSGMKTASLGKRILRYETAALMTMALGAYARNLSPES